ncbi:MULTISPECIES: XRE family transcriptional regulator [Priestia]|uniref:XRE family transcriptional regulator n=1 Tax=Priestia TaxID=2800373 RepID=UPI00196A4B86|nr:MULTISPECIES: XRE family transcriptional regulator [Priestia]MCE4093109.1 XRE family transcriptional regulator [Priestia megaterium]MED3821512.1 XRE family transcriptional regulator [Priestia aryabhattai]QSF42350.1 XRE family transcriptional regulator [Priestia megaterium]
MDKSFKDLINISDEYYTKKIDKSKLKIALSIKQQLSNENLSLRRLSHKLNMSHPQIVRVTTRKNYNIDTLLKILEALDLELVVQEKRKN